MFRPKAWLAALALSGCVLGGCAQPVESPTARYITVKQTIGQDVTSIQGRYDLWTKDMVVVEIVGQPDARVWDQYNREADRIFHFWETAVAAVAAGAKELGEILVSTLKPKLP